MLYEEYKQKAKETAIFDPKVANEYLSLGLDSEIGEVCGVIKKYIRDGFSEELLKEKLEKEIGDCFWYLAMINLYFFPNMEFDLNDMHDPYSYEEDLSISNFMLKIVKPVETNFLTAFLISANSPYSTTNTISYFIQLLCALVNFCRQSYLDLDVNTILYKNIEKLQSRKKRDKLSGDGDNR